MLRAQRPSNFRAWGLQKDFTRAWGPMCKGLGPLYICKLRVFTYKAKIQNTNYWICAHYGMDNGLTSHLALLLVVVSMIKGSPSSVTGTGKSKGSFRHCVCLSPAVGVNTRCASGWTDRRGRTGEGGGSLGVLLLQSYQRLRRPCSVCLTYRSE